MNQFLMGAICMGSVVASLLFIRFWLQCRDRLFLYFAAAFALEAVDRIILVLGSTEEGIAYYLVRLLSYLLILWAIIEKNSHRSR